MTDAPAAAPISAAVERRLGRYVDGHPDARSLPWGRTAAAPGAAWAVITGDHTVTGGLGVSSLDGALPDAHTVFRIASMTKSFTAAAVLRLRDLGVLALSDPVTRWVPGATGLAQLAGGPPTVDALLRMAATLGTDDPWGDRMQALDRHGFDRLMQSAATSAVPRGTFEYSNYGFALLGRVIEAVTGRSFMDEISEAILGPLGMTHTTWHAPADMATGYVIADGAVRWMPEPVDRPGAFGAMGGLFSTVTDIATWMRFLMEPAAGSAAGGPDTVLGTSSRVELQLPRTPRGTVRPTGAAPHHPVLTASYGYGLNVGSVEGSDMWVWHSGGYPGFGSSMVWLPRHHVAVTVLMNGRYAPATRIALAVAHDLTRPEPSPSRPPSVRSVPVSQPADPAPRATPHPQFVSLMADVNALLTGRSSVLLPGGLPMAANMELDEAWSARSRDIAEALGDAAGPWTIGQPVMDTALRGSWRLGSGQGSALRSVDVEMWLTPLDPWEIQVLDVTAVPAPSEALDVAGRAAHAVWQAAVTDPARARGVWTELAVASVAGETLEPPAVVGGDGTTWASWRYVTARGAWSVSLGVDPHGAVTQVEVSPG